MRLCVHSPLFVEDAVVSDGDDRTFESGTEFGMNVYCRAVTIPLQGTVTVTMHLYGTLTDPDRTPEIWEQPLANPLVLPEEDVPAEG